MPQHYNHNNASLHKNTSLFKVRLQQFASIIQSFEPWELGAKLTLLTLLLSPVGDWYVKPLILTVCFIGLIVPNLWRSHILWFSLALLTALRFIMDWPLSDNHAYLLSYWCLALGLSFWLKNQHLLIANARYLIGMVFLLAALQKWTSPDYINDVFFLTTFLLDERFEDFVVLFTSVSFEQIDMARDYFEGDYRKYPAAETFPFVIPDSLRWLATASTYWNLFEQTLIAIAFLVPVNSFFGRLRDAALLAFCFSIYLIVPVVSFGWLLLAMGITQCDRESSSMRLWYLFAFIVLIFYDQVPWAHLINQI